jgi:hypothetical protein
MILDCHSARIHAHPFHSFVMPDMGMVGGQARSFGSTADLWERHSTNVTIISRCVGAGQEVGFYAGCVATWQQLLALDPSRFPGRAEKGIASLAALLQGFSLSDPQVAMTA